MTQQRQGRQPDERSPGQDERSSQQQILSTTSHLDPPVFTFPTTHKASSCIPSMQNQCLLVLKRFPSQNERLQSKEIGLILAFQTDLAHWFVSSMAQDQWNPMLKQAVRHGRDGSLLSSVPCPGIHWHVLNRREGTSKRGSCKDPIQSMRGAVLGIVQQWELGTLVQCRQAPPRSYILGMLLERGSCGPHCNQLSL